MNTEMDKPLSIAILALGGQGGGVLTRWMVDLARANGFLAQSTYVAGVAQRTGATVYCIEMFPEEQANRKGSLPVFTPYPVPGDVDLVVAGELAETGRAIQKGFVTPNTTTLISSSHRDYSISEKSALGDGIIDLEPVVVAAKKASRNYMSFDMAKAAKETNSVISAVMLGSIAASGTLPFSKVEFENIIRKDSRSVESNLAGFAAGFAGARQADVPTPLPAKKAAVADGPAGRVLIKRIHAEFPPQVQYLASHGALRTLTYQDKTYADQYLDRLAEIVVIDQTNEGKRGTLELSLAFARQLALQMCYEDTIRVAEIKTAKHRYEEVRTHLNVGLDQPVHVVEYFHPRYEEFCDTLPRRLGSYFQKSERWKRLLKPMFCKGRNITTSHISGFILLSLLAGMKRWRRVSYRFATQKELIEQWFSRIKSASGDYDEALAITECMEIVRGYGETYERGLSRYQRIFQAIEQLDSSKRANTIRHLHQAAMSDEAGKLFKQKITELETQ